MNERPEPSQVVPSNRLNGWKEIAAYLQKSVRSAQRWGRESGLPVHRVGGEGKIVYALKTEIDEWFARTDEASLRSDELESADDEPAPAARALPWMGSARGVFGLSAIVLVGAGSLATVFFAGSATHTTALPPSLAFAEVQYGILRARDANGRILWTRASKGLEERSYPRSSSDTDSASKLRVLDLDGDGEKEIVVNMADELDPRGALATFAFNADGSLRFRHVAGRSVSYGGQSYSDFGSLDLYELPEGSGHSSLWVTGHSRSEFPSVLERLDARGRVVSEYWSPGFITDVQPLRLPDGRNALAVGAFHNETGGASVTLLGRDNASGRAPSVDPRYLCDTCPPSSPLAFLVFPRSDVLAEATADEGEASIWSTRLDDRGRLSVSVRQHGEAIPGQKELVLGIVTYTLAAGSFELLDLYAGPGYRTLHDQLAAAGRLGHGFGPSDERALSAVRIWRDGRYVPVRVAASW